MHNSGASRRENAKVYLAVAAGVWLVDECYHDGIEITVQVLVAGKKAAQS